MSKPAAFLCAIMLAWARLVGSAAALSLDEALERAESAPHERRTGSPPCCR